MFAYVMQWLKTEYFILPTVDGFKGRCWVAWYKVKLVLFERREVPLSKASQGLSWFPLHKYAWHSVLELVHLSSNFGMAWKLWPDNFFFLRIQKAPVVVAQSRTCSDRKNKYPDHMPILDLHPIQNIKSFLLFVDRIEVVELGYHRGKSALYHLHHFQHLFEV